MHVAVSLVSHSCSQMPAFKIRVDCHSLGKQLLHTITGHQGLSAQPADTAVPVALDGSNTPFHPISAPSSQ